MFVCLVTYCNADSDSTPSCVTSPQLVISKCSKLSLSLDNSMMAVSSKYGHMWNTIFFKCFTFSASQNTNWVYHKYQLTTWLTEEMECIYQHAISIVPYYPMMSPTQRFQWIIKQLHIHVLHVAYHAQVPLHCMSIV